MLVLASIGPVKAWGYPENNDDLLSLQRAKQYMLASINPCIQLNAKSIEPDFVLVDGRFRVGSFLASAMFSTKTINLLFDDYVGRSRYHLVEEICRPERFIGRAALFVLNPSQIRESGVIFKFLPSMLNAG